MSNLRSISTGALLLAMLAVNCKRPTPGPSTRRTSTKKSAPDEAKRVPQKLEEQKQVGPKENPAGNHQAHEAKPENLSEPKVESAISSQKVPELTQKLPLSDQTDDCKTPRSHTPKEEPTGPKTPDRTDSIQTKYEGGLETSSSSDEESEQAPKHSLPAPVLKSKSNKLSSNCLDGHQTPYKKPFSKQKEKGLKRLQKWISEKWKERKQRRCKLRSTSSA